MNIQEELIDWAKKVVKKYNSIANGISYYTQSNLWEIQNNPQVLILGINPGSIGTDEGKDYKTFLEGNKSFSTDVNWRLWKILIKIFNAGGIDSLLKDKKDFVFSNIFHLGTLKAEALSKDITKDDELIELTRMLIRILKPSFVICLGQKDCMMKLIKKPESLIDGELSYAEMSYAESKEQIPIYGIPHTSKFYTNEEITMLGRVLGSLYRKEIRPEKECISNTFKEEIHAFEERRDQLSPDSISNTMIEDSFKRYAGKDIWEKKGGNIWYRLSTNFIFEVTHKNGGAVIINDCGFRSDNNYSKRTIPNQEAIKKYLKEKGYDCNNTSLGSKPFKKYKEWKDGPQHVVLAILKDMDEFESELEAIYEGEAMCTS